MKVPIMVRMDQETVQALDKIVRRIPSLETRASAIRECVRLGILAINENPETIVKQVS